MNYSVQTVKIKTEDGYAVINQHDFVEGQHELFVDSFDGDDELPEGNDNPDDILPSNKPKKTKATQ